MRTPLLRAVSVVGLALLLVAFVANRTGAWTSDDTLYLLLNGCGAGLLAWYALAVREWVFVVLETIWAVVSFWPLVVG